MDNKYEFDNNAGPPVKKTSTVKIVAIIAIALFIVGAVSTVYVFTSGLVDYQGTIYSDTYTESKENAKETEDDEQDSVFNSAYDDYAFHQWLIESANTIGTDCGYVADYITLGDYSSAATWSGILEYDADKYLDEINDYFVSSKWQPIQSEYEEALEDMSWAGYYGELGLEYLDVDYINMATNYMEKATVHIETCTAIIEDLLD